MVKHYAKEIYLKCFNKVQLNLKNVLIIKDPACKKNSGKKSVSDDFALESN